MNLVDTIAAGRVSAQVLAEVSIGTAMWGIAMLFLIGTMMALSPEISNQRGSQRRDFAATLAQALYLAMILVVIALLYLSAAPALMRLAGIDATIIPGAMEFLRGIAWGAPALGAYIALLKFCEGMGRPKAGLYFGVAGLLILVPLAFGFVQGAYGLPRWLAYGCGFATAIVHWLNFFGLAIYVFVQFRSVDALRRWPKPDFQRMWTIAKLGLPIAVMILMEAGLFYAVLLLISKFGKNWVAAHTVAINVASLAFMTPLGLAHAVAVRCGFAMGQNDKAGVLRAAKSGWLLCLGSQTISGGLMLSLAIPISALYLPSEPAVTLMAAQLLFLAALFQFPDGIQAVTAGALRGVLDTQIPMLLTAIAYWGLGFPLAYYLAFVAGFGPTGLWYGFILGLTAAALMLPLRFAYVLRRMPNLHPARI